MSRLQQIRASAGSGKTFTLTRRFLRHLVSCSDAPDAGPFACAPPRDDIPVGFGGILAVTFTNAAATEMRDRVIGDLKKTALGLPLHGEMPALDREEAFARLDAIMRDLSALNIRTIDSLLLHIVRAAALDLNLHPDLEPVFSTGEALGPYLDLLMEQAWRGDAAMRALVRELCEALVFHDRAGGFLAEGALTKKVHDLFDAALRGELDELSGESALKRRLRDIRDAAQSAARDFLDRVEEEGLLPSLYANARNAARKLAEGDCGRNTVYAAKPDAGELFRKGTRVSGRVERAYAAYSEHALRLRREQPLLDNAVFNHPFAKTALILARAFESNLRREGRLPMLLVPSRAERALAAENGVPDMLCRLGTRFTHFLLDEFQDTSREQWGAMYPLIEDALARGGTLTCVGDLKQSVYGWRGADPELFSEVFSDPGLTRIAGRADFLLLPENRRSLREIVDFNNRFFSPLEQEDIAEEVMKSLLPAETPEALVRREARRLRENFEKTAQKCAKEAEEGGFVRMERMEAETAEALDALMRERVLALLRDELRPGRPWSDVFILVRDNEDARKIAERCMEEGIPVITENSLLLAEHPLIRQTTAFLRFLDNPEDDIAFWTMIGGGIFLKHPEAGELSERLLSDFLVGRERGESLHKAFSRGWPGIWKRLIAPFHNQAGLMSFYDIVKEWYARLDAEERFPGARPFLRCFLEVLHRAEGREALSLSEFLRLWDEKGDEEKIPMPENMDAVRVMTIHKAKGLEAPVVIVPGTNFTTRGDDKPGLCLLGDLRLVVTGGDRPDEEERCAERARRARENMNLLYVAFTRAEEELYIFAETTGRPGRRKSLGNAVRILAEKAGFSGLDQTFGTRPLRTMRREEAEAEVPEARRSAPAEDFPDDWFPMDWMPQLKIFRNPLGAFVFKAEDRGKLLHFCLEHLRISGDPQRDAGAAFSFALNRFPAAVPDDPALREEILSSLVWFAARPEAARWLVEASPEHPLVDEEGRLLRVDLLVRRPWGLLVVDYKSGARKAEDALQMRRYLRCLEMSEKKKALAALVYFQQKRFQIVGAEDLSPLLERCPPLPDFPREAAHP
jgi:ATP-dependent exoDNAse (exonuclease V) beta subunit